jgi:hypothetical protein
METFLKSTKSFIVDFTDIGKRFFAEISVVDVAFDYIMTSWSAEGAMHFCEAEPNFLLFMFKL